jgi:hypothetical protein
LGLVSRAWTITNKKKTAPPLEDVPGVRGLVVLVLAVSLLAFVAAPSVL